MERVEVQRRESSPRRESKKSGFCDDAFRFLGASVRNSARYSGHCFAGGQSEREYSLIVATDL